MPIKESPQKGRTYEKEVYSPEEIRALLARTSSTAPSAVRNYALIVTLWQAGLRMNEALELRPGDFDLGLKEIFVRHGKSSRYAAGPKFRRVRCGSEAVDATARWLGVRSQLDLPDDAPLFCTLEGKKLYSSYFRSTLQRLAKGAGIGKRVHPHGLRHTFAVNLAKNGVPVPIIQRQLGHSSLATTSVYLQAISTEDVAEAMQNVTW